MRTGCVATTQCLSGDEMFQAGVRGALIVGYKLAYHGAGVAGPCGACDAAHAKKGQFLAIASLTNDSVALPITDVP